MFQRHMNSCLEKWLWREAIAVVDDVAIGTDDVESHVPIVTEIMCMLAEKGFSVKAEKMFLFVKEFVFLGHLSTEEGLKPTDHLVKAVQDMQPPTAEDEDPKKRLRSFLGMASYARKFVKNFAKVVHPLNRLLENGVKFEWSEECQLAWDSVTNALAEKKGVYPVDYSQPLYIRTDACCEGLGAYLFQLVTVPRVDKDGKTVNEKQERVVEYWSRSVPKECRHYEARRLELMAVILALEHFKPYIDGVRVQLDTDHRNLTFLKNIKHSSGQLARWAMRLSEYDFDLKYRPGKHMEMADCLSRNALPIEPTEEEMATLMYCANFTQVELGKSESPQTSQGAVFKVTFGTVEEVEAWDSERHGCAALVTTYDRKKEQRQQKESLGIHHKWERVQQGLQAMERDNIYGAREVLKRITAAPTQANTGTGDSSDSNDDEELKQADLDRLQAMSRDVIPIQEFVEAYKSDEQATRLLQAWDKGEKDQKRDRKWKRIEGVIYKHKEGRNERQYVPKSLRTRIMRMYHDSDWNMHSGKKATLQDIKGRYYWVNMDQEVGEYVRNCFWCRLAKSTVPLKAGLLQQTLHQHSGAVLSMDLVGPFRMDPKQKHRQQYDYVLTVLDVFSHKLIIEPICSKGATAVLEAFIKRVVCQGLLPSRIVSVDEESVDRDGVIVTDNGTEFRNELMQTFLQQFKVRFGYSIPYHPQSNPVERAHRYVGALLRIAVNRSDSTSNDWWDSVPFIEFAYNKMEIPGTKVSPFMLSNGFQPRYPEDVMRSELRCKNKTYQEKLEEVTKRYQEMEKIVREAHEVEKAKQKVHYDMTHYDVEFKVGQKVLWFCEDGLDKLHFKWHGPYTVLRRVSDVKYEIKDELDGEIRPVSVQQIVPFFGETYQWDEDSEMLDQRNEFAGLKVGHFVVCQLSSDTKWNALHVAEILEPYNPLTRSVVLHHYVDLGKSGEDLSKFDVTKDIAKRRVFPEYEYDNEEGEAVSYAKVRSNQVMKPESREVKYAYALQGNERLRIIAKNFNIQTGGKVPTNVCAQVRAYLDQNKPVAGPARGRGARGRGARGRGARGRGNKGRGAR